MWGVIMIEIRIFIPQQLHVLKKEKKRSVFPCYRIEMKIPGTIIIISFIDGFDKKNNFTSHNFVGCCVHDNIDIINDDDVL
jgi:hypothetical protein